MYKCVIYCVSLGPTSFSPIIEMATTIVEQSGGQYHVLVIIADGQVYCTFLCILLLQVIIIFLILSEENYFY
jgi:hypothetical protein